MEKMIKESLTNCEVRKEKLNKKSEKKLKLKLYYSSEFSRSR